MLTSVWELVCFQSCRLQLGVFLCFYHSGDQLEEFEFCRLNNYWTHKLSTESQANKVLFTWPKISNDKCASNMHPEIWIIKKQK